MTIAGWILMLLSCGTVTALVVFCYTRLLRSSRDRGNRSTER